MDLQYKPTHKELENYLENWGNNRKKTDAQRAMYPKKIRRDMLGNEVIQDKNGEKDCIRLLKEDGWDGGYVGSVAPQTAKEYYWKKDNQVYPQIRDLLRIGLFFHEDFYRILVLIIKSDCERYIYNCLLRDGLDGGIDSITLIENIKIDNKYLVDYAFDIRKRMKIDDLYNLFEEHNSLASVNGYDRSTFEALIMDIAVNKVQAYALRSEYVEKFISDRVKESHVLADEGFTDKELYYKLKQSWTELRSSIEQLLLQQDEIRERNYKIRATWSKSFGKLKIEEDTLLNVKEKLEYLINLKESNMDKSYEEIIQLVEATIGEKRKELEEEMRKIEFLISSAKMLDQKELLARIGGSGMSMTDQMNMENKIKEMQKSLFWKVFKLTHPDKTKNENFTEEQILELETLFKSIGDLKETHNLDIMETMVLLESILRKVERIWSSMGVNTDDFEMDILNSDPAEIIKKLEIKLECLEEEEAKIRNEIFILLNDSEINAMEIVLANDETSRMEEHRYKDRISKLKQEIKEYKETVTELFDVETAELACSA
ncbi:MAG: hypothetical protein JXN65_02475 [Clostridia bacterium]|nr:hypothetical protein [Clostridia bacterium]